MPLIAGNRTENLNGYSLDRPVSVGVRESTWLARDPAGLSCVVEFWERFDGSPRSGIDLDAFVERAVLQRRVAIASGACGSDLGRGHVIAVRALEATEWGSFLVREPYAVSASELVAGKVRLRADAIQEIVAGLVDALVLFQRHAGRPHGALSTSAVLISDDQPGKRRIGLREPATADEIAAQGDAAGEELRGLGQLIFELVLHRPFRTMGGYPVRDGAEWQAMGKAGAFWLGLTNELLEPSGCRLTLEDVAARIAGLSFRVDRPGAGVWLGRIGIAAAVVGLVGGGAWWVLKPGIEPPRADFVELQFERWLRVAPVVASLREGVGAMEAPPPALVAAMDRLAISEEERGRFGDVEDLFNVPAVFEQAGLFKGFERSFDDPLPNLISGVRTFAEEDFAARAISQKETEDQRRLEQLAGLFEEGLLRYAGDGELTSALGLLSEENWAARGVIEGLGSDGEYSWIGESASALFAGAGSIVDTSLASFPEGVADEGVFAQATAENPLKGGRLASVDEFLEAAKNIEDAAARLGAWRDEVYPRIEAASAAVSAASAWPAVAGVDAARIGGDGDPYLASFGRVPSRVAVVGDGETVEDLDRRLRRMADSADAVRAFIESSWSADGVDLIAHGEWVDSVRDRLEAEPSGTTGGALSSWIDARVELSGEWLREARETGVLAVSEWPASGFSIDIGGTRGKWDEAFSLQPKETSDAETEQFGSAGVVVARLASLESRFAALRRMPRWPSLRAEVGAEVSAIRAEFDELAASVDRIYNFVLQPPEELIAVWRQDSVNVGSGPESVSLSALRLAVGERVISDWEAWDAASSLDDKTKKSEPETDRLRIGLRGVDDVVVRAAEQIRTLLAEGHSFGGYNGDAVREIVAARMGQEFAGLSAMDSWEQKSAHTEGGEFSLALDSIRLALSAQLAQLDGELGLLADAGDGIARGYVAGEDTGGRSVADVEALRSTSESLRGGWASSVAGIREIDAALLAVEALVAVDRIDDPDRLLEAFVAEAEAAGRAGIATAAIRRLDSIGEGSGWPVSAGELAAQRQSLIDGLVAFRGAVPEADWDGRAAELQQIVRGWWLRGVSLSGDRAAFARAVDGASEWFDQVDDAWVGLLGADLLTGRSRFNAQVVEIRSVIADLARDAVSASAVADESAIAAIDRRLISEVGARLGEIDAAASQSLADGERGLATAWVRDFERELDDARGGRRGWDARSFGPTGSGIPGWTPVLNEDVEPPRVIYRSAGTSGNPLEVEFRLVTDLPSGGQVFLSVDEVSVELCAEILRTKGDDIGERRMDGWFGRAGNEYAGNLVEGPTTRAVFVRGRNKTRFRMRSPDFWLEGGEYGMAEPDVAYPAYPAGLNSSASFNAIAESQGEPDLAHPVNYIQASLASSIAEAFGCRLPTVEEFNAALSLVPSAGSGRWNLRDSSFAAQLANFEEAAKLDVTHYRPGKWSYDGTNGASAATWQVAGADDRLWFYKTGAREDGGFQDGLLFRHLIGNVAEYVLAADGATGSSGMRIMGASALSDPSVQPAAALPTTGPNTSPNGFVDVGFRLAIDADDFGSLGKMVQKQLEATESGSFLAGTE